MCWSYKVIAAGEWLNKIADFSSIVYFACHEASEGVC